MEFPKHFVPEHKASNQDAAYTDAFGVTTEQPQLFCSGCKHSSNWRFSSAELEVKTKKTVLKNWIR